MDLNNLDNTIQKAIHIEIPAACEGISLFWNINMNNV